MILTPILQTTRCRSKLDTRLLQEKIARHSTPSSVAYVVQDANNGQVLLPPVTGNGQPNAQDAKNTFIPQMILSCFVFWMFGFIFGLIAFILARK